MTKDERDALRQLCEAATPGPWVSFQEDSAIEAEEGGAICHIAHHAYLPTAMRRNEDWSHANAAFIAAARTALPKLLDYVEELEKKLESVCFPKQIEEMF